MDVNQGHQWVVVERRQFLRVSLGALTALCFGRQGVLGEEWRTQEPLSWDSLTETAVSLAEQVVRNVPSDEERYLLSLIQLIERGAGIPKAHFNLSRPVGIHQSLLQFPLLVLQFRLAPGAAIPFHDHRNYISALTVIEGSLCVRSFEIVGSGPPPQPRRTFQIRQTNTSILKSGAHSTLSRTRDNIHDLRAGPEGARFVDFLTLFENNARSVDLVVAERAANQREGIFNATWDSQ